MIWRTSKPEKDIILFDLEGDSLDPDKIHCVSYCTIYSNGKWCNFKTVPINTITSLPEMKKFFESDVYFCGHNIALWDIPCAVNKLVTKNIKNDLIDTLWISRYIFPNITKHGLADWGDLFGVPKPVVEDWENSPLHVYVERCEEDVRINSVLMGHIMKKLNYLYEEESNKWKCIWYLNFLADTVALQEKVKWKLDVERCQKMFDKLSFEKQEKIDSLKLVMPRNPIKSKRKRPKVTEKRDGTPNAHYVKWIKFLKDQKLPLDTEGEVEYIKGYEEGNPSSPIQIKNWLYSLGWIPKNFSYVKDKDTGKNRAIPQILVDKKGEKVLCPSVRKLLSREPNLELLEGISVLTHRIGMFKGFLSNVDKDGYLKASAAGLTNCVTADTIITTSIGAIPITQVTKEHEVLTHTGKWKPVTDFINNGVRTVYEIKTESGKILKCTSEHRLYKGDESWIFAKDLKKGDVVKGYGGREIWRQIKDSTQGVCVSSWGRVRTSKGKISLYRKRTAKNIRGGVSYTNTEGIKVDRILSRVLMENFVGVSDLHVLHKDGKSSNDNIQNLYYGTDQTNHMDAKSHGTLLKANRNRDNNKLTMEDAKEIRSLYKKGLSQADLAVEYKISSAHVCNIVNNKVWKEKRSVDNSYREEFCDEVIKSIETSYEEPTYDISVKDDHSYIANGFVTHNTTRLRHKVLVNLPGNGKPYGEDVRGCLIAPDGYELCGSDLSSLENRTMQHFIYNIDPDYVNSMMQDDFDPHCDLGLIAGIMTQEDVDFYKSVEDPNELSHDDHDKYGIIKSERHKSKTTVYCVPTDTTEILTDSGWKFYHQITMSDKVLSLNTDTGKTEFTGITEIPHFEDVEIVNVKHRDFNFECTPNHRWWTQRRSGKLRKSKTYEFKETKDFSTETNIICSAKFSGDSQREDLSVLDLKLLGVILGDGSVSFSKVTNNTSQSNGKVQVKATVTQKRFVKEISDLIGMVLPSTTFKLSHKGITKFQFSSPEFRNWWTNKLGFGHTNKHDVDYEKFILTLDQDQIESFIEGIFITDGGYKKGVNSKQYYQCTGNIEKSIITGLTLIGKRIRYYDQKLHSGKVIRTITASDTTHTSYQKGRTTNSRTCNVFCVNNINGTFIMRQGDSISITGNSATYGIGARKLSIELDISLQEASALLKAYWKRNWSIKVLCKKQKIKRLRIGGETEMWLFNPMSKLWYSLRYEKDIFSTLNQGAGTFVFNSWVKCLRKKRNLITGQFHDEIILTVKKGYRKECKELVINSLQEVNDELNLNREMACDVQFGDNYSQIH